MYLSSNEQGDVSQCAGEAAATPSVRLQSVIEFEPCVAVRCNEMAKSCGTNLYKIIVTKMQSLAILLGHVRAYVLNKHIDV